jgi:DNA-binding PadR family transcriptional regulator
MKDPNLNHIYRVYTLLMLKTDSRHGYEVIDKIEEMTGDKPSTSHIYPFLSELEENGYLEAEKGSRGKKIYSLTEDGKDLVSDQLSSFGEMINTVIQGEVHECSHCSCQIYENGYREDGEIYCCKHCASSAK